MRGICTDNPGIENLISKGLVYVDKTDVLHALIADPAASQYFLSRPRRFGKSLMIATLREIFKGRRDLFRDTFIGRSDYDWPIYPVIHLDLSKVVASTPELLDVKLNGIVEDIAARYSAPFNDDKPSGENFGRLILHAAASTERKQVVVLIDEYDAPVNGFIDNPEKLMAFRDVMHQFFLVLKANVERIRFLMATGVTRFTKISLFSCLNNPTDLSMDRRAARLCGYTPEEIEANFHEHIQAFADEKGITYEAMFGELLAWYDSYRFSPDADVRVCNPVSLGKALVNRVLMNYWESTGLASAALMRVKANRRIISDWNGIEVERTSLDASDMGNMPLETLLYQTGYLTIKESFDDGVISLKVPNYEALDQIKARGYADAYRDDPRPVWLIGCNYNPATRNLDRPAIERMRFCVN